MAISSPRDGNRVVATMITSNVDGASPMVIQADTSHNLLTSDGTTGSGFSYVNAERDDNRIPVLWAVSSSDGTTPVPVYGDPTTGKLLIQST